GELHAALPSASPRRASSPGIPSTTHEAGSSPFASRMPSRGSGRGALAAMRVPSGLHATHWPAYFANSWAANAARLARNLRLVSRYAGMFKGMRISRAARQAKSILPRCETRDQLLAARLTKPLRELLGRNPGPLTPQEILARWPEPLLSAGSLWCNLTRVPCPLIVKGH